MQLTITFTQWICWWVVWCVKEVRKYSHLSWNKKFLIFSSKRFSNLFLHYSNSCWSTMSFKAGLLLYDKSTCRTITFQKCEQTKVKLLQWPVDGGRNPLTRANHSNQLAEGPGEDKGQPEPTWLQLESTCFLLTYNYLSTGSFDPCTV